MLAYTELLRAEPANAERLTAEALASGPAASSPLLQFGLQAVQGAAVFDLGDRVDGLAELQRSRSDFADHETGPEHAAAMAMLEFRFRPAAGALGRGASFSGD
jgi:LuxR family maltose regulon positive regulatory protein